MEYFKLRKGIYVKPTAIIVLNEKKLVFPLRTEVKQRYLFLLLFLNTILKVLAGKERQGKKMEGVGAGNGREEMSICTENKYLHRKLKMIYK